MFCKWSLSDFIGCPPSIAGWRCIFTRLMHGCGWKPITHMLVEDRETAHSHHTILSWLLAYHYFHHTTTQIYDYSNTAALLRYLFWLKGNEEMRDAADGCWWAGCWCRSDAPHHLCLLIHCPSQIPSFNIHQYLNLLLIFLWTWL